LIDLGIKDVEHFPFITSPRRGPLAEAVEELVAMGAIDVMRNLTELGQRMVPFPLTPRLARMIASAADESPGVLFEVLTIGALLSVRWPQIMPPGEEEEARIAHRKFSDRGGDLIAGLHMVEAYERARDRERFCERYYLDPVIMEELIRVRSQLAEIAARHGVEGGQGGPMKGVLKAVTAAFPRHICRRIGRSAQYETPSGIRVKIHPGSCLSHSRPNFITASEIVITRRPWARSVSSVEPEWITELAPDLARHWKIREPRRSKTKTTQARFPGEVTLGGRNYRVRVKRGIPMIRLEWKQAIGLTADTRTDWPNELRPVCVNLHVFGKRLIKKMPLPQLLRTLPYLRLSEPPVENWPQDDVLMPDRDLWKILPVLPNLMRLVFQRSGRRPAFLALVHNGSGGYWFDGIHSLELALEQNETALSALTEDVMVTDEERPAIAAARQTLLDLEDALKGS